MTKCRAVGLGRHGKRPAPSAVVELEVAPKGTKHTESFAVSRSDFIRTAGLVSPWLAMALMAMTSALAAPPPTNQAADRAEARVTFEGHIVPILRKHCWKCHGATSGKAELDLRTLTGVLQGGESGETLVVPRKPRESHFFTLVAEGEMPPPDSLRLTRGEIETFERWIASGAAGQSHVGKDESSERLERARQIRFLLEVRCHQCHGRKTKHSDLDLWSIESIQKGGTSGPALVPGDADSSLMVRRIEADEMPPRDVRYKLSIKPVTESVSVMNKQWIDEGAVAPPLPPGIIEDDGLLVGDEDRQWWSFRPPRRPPVPEV